MTHLFRLSKEKTQAKKTWMSLSLENKRMLAAKRAEEVELEMKKNLSKENLKKDPLVVDPLWGPPPDIEEGDTPDGVVFLELQFDCISPCDIKDKEKWCGSNSLLID